MTQLGLMNQMTFSSGLTKAETLETFTHDYCSKQLEIDPNLVQYTFWKKCNYKYRGLDVLSASLLEKNVVFVLFQKSINSCIVPTLRKKSTITPVPNTSCPSANNGFGPVALTSVLMKCFEKLIVNMLKTEVAANWDPLQFACRQGRSTEDTVISVNLLIKHTLKTRRLMPVFYL